MSNPLESWTARLADELGVDPAAVDLPILLDLAREAAHNVARPAAPLTTFLVGLAAGLRGGDVESVRTAAGTASRLAAEEPGAEESGTEEPRAEESGTEEPGA